jgi:hypothetical protein
MTKRISILYQLKIAELPIENCRIAGMTPS